MSRREQLAPLLLAAAMAWAVGCKRAEPPVTPPPDGEATDLLDQTRLPGLSSEARPLRQYMGKRGLLVVLLDTTCPTSSQLLAEMPQVVKTLARREIATVLVNLGDRAADVREHYRLNTPGTEVLYDETDATARQWQVNMVPAVVFVDPDDGVLYTGEPRWGQMASAVEPALGMEPGDLGFGTDSSPYGTGFG